MSMKIEVPDDLYAKVASYAKRHGQTPEQVLLASVAEVLQQDQQIPTAGGEEDPDIDPIAPFIGTFTFGRGDLAEHHDAYLAESSSDASDHGKQPVR